MKNKRILPKKNKKGVVIEGLVVDSKMYWDSNPDKAKTYKRKEYKGKKLLTPKEAEIFLEISGEWLHLFMQGKKGFPKLPYVWDEKNVATIKFIREDLVKYRSVLQERQFNIKTRPQRK